LQSTVQFLKKDSTLHCVPLINGLKFLIVSLQILVNQAQFLGSDSSARVRSLPLFNFGQKVKEKKYTPPSTLYK